MEENFLQPFGSRTFTEITAEEDEDDDDSRKQRRKLTNNRPAPGLRLDNKCFLKMMEVMEEAEHSVYVAQLKAEFDSCDTTCTGFLDRDELTELCRKLQLDAHLPPLLDTLLGERTYGRVNFEEFKDGFVAVLSRSLDFSTSEDDSSYLEPAVPEEVKPKFVKGAKRYGRRSRPDGKLDAALTCDSEDSPPSRTEPADLSPPAVRRAKLRRATSLESVESLKSDEETGNQKNVPPLFQNKGDEQDEELEGGGSRHVGGRQQLHTQDVDVLLGRLDADLDGRVSITEFKRVFCSSAPFSSSTPTRSADIQRATYGSQPVSEELSARSASPSLLTATVGQRVLSRLDNGSGCTSPERVAALWTEEGIRNSRDILQTLDFPLEERLSLADLTLALDNELLVSGNGIHQAALISYKNEIQHLQEVAEQACRQRDKLRADLDVADQRNLQLVREVDDRHASMETLNESRIRDLEQDYRDRLSTLRCQSEQESEALLQQLERERHALQDELQLLRAKEAELQEELCSAAQENRRLEEELSAVKLKLTETASSVTRLQGDLNQLLHDKLGSLDAAGAGLSHEERFSEFTKEYELQCRELRDRNDELSSELELLKSNRKSRRSAGDGDALSWSQQHAESDSDSDMKRSSSPARRKKLQPDDKTALSSLDAPGPAVSIQTELAVEQLKQNHQQELQQLNIQLETQVNYYERSLEKMRQSVEVERKDICQAFKLEISELEEQKSQAEQQVKQLKEALDRLQTQIHQGGGGGGWSNEQERRLQRDRAELETNFAREISNLVQKLSAEKEQLEAELKLKMDQEVMAVREESNLQLARVALQREEQVSGLQAGLEASGRRCSELEARLQDNITFLESQELLSRRLASEKSGVEEELRRARGQGSRLTAELDSLKTDRARLIQDLKEQAMAVDDLRLELDAVSEELRRRSSGEAEARSGLAEQTEEARRLSLENRTYIRLVDQLSTQIVEMEEEISTLREHLRGLSQQLNGTADLVLDLRKQLNAKTKDVDRFCSEAADRQVQNGELQRALRDSQNQLRSAEEELDGEKKKMARQLEQLERLVLDLEDVMDPGSPHRTRLEEVRSENGALQEKVGVLQQEVQNLEDDVAKKRRRLEEMERDHERSREEEERLRKENSKHREEVLDLSSRNLQLSGDNGELSARLRGEQESVRMLRERLATVSREQEEEGAAVRRLQDAVTQQEREKLQQQTGWKQEKLLLERELSSTKEKLGRQSQLEAELSSVALKLQWVEEDKERLQRDVDDRNNKVEQLQQQLVSLEAEAELLGSQLHAVTQEEAGHAQETTELQRKLQDALSKVEELEGGARRLMKEKEELRLALEEQEVQASVTMQEETRRLRVHNQELQQQLSELQVQDVQVHKLTQEQQNLKTRLNEVEAARMQAQDQVVRADAALSVAQAQHLRRLQELQEQAGGQEEAELLQQRLEEAVRRSRELEEALKLQNQQSSSQISMKQEQYEKAAAALEQRVEDLEVQLKAVRLVLQEKVQQLKEQMAKSSKASALLKDLYVENSQLMKALQVTEQRQKHAEKKSFLLEEKVGALNTLLRQIVPAALAT